MNEERKTMSEHEEWEAQESPEGYLPQVYCKSGNGYLVALADPKYSSHETANRNVRLMAAAPELHFNGIQNKTCKAGVEYDSVRVEGCGLPCLTHLGKGAELECEKRRFPTEQEIKDRIEEQEKAMATMFAGLSAVVEDANRNGFGKGNGGQGAVACPVCDGGTIHYSVAGYNGHHHARCTTDGCVAFMQ